MALLTDIWFPNGAPLTALEAVVAAGGQYDATLENLALPDVAARISLVADPSGSGDTVCRLWHPAADSAINDNGRKTQLTPVFTSVNRDPITNWVGQSASRRWYRFKFMLPSDWEWETWNNNSQRCVVFQVHDSADTSPADFDVSPSLWVIANPDRTFHFVVTSCADAQTTVSNFAVRSTAVIRPKPGVAMEIVVFSRWAYDNTGSLAIWVDRRKVWDETGKANCANHDPARGGSGNFALLDAYCAADVLDRVVYHWGIQIGDESYGSTSAGYADFVAACGAGGELERVMTNGVSVG